MKFRYDINALRALAVTAVVLYHYRVGFSRGGFVGVDVFFVISGYLMTTIIMGRLVKGKFSIWDFYYDRARRIVPGLLGLCFVLLAAGYFLLEPGTYQYLGSTSIAALLFFSNFGFWKVTGYFDPESDVNWLLHTWSLSVEWQFYMLYPIILVVLYHFDKTRRHIVLILWTMAILSLLSCIWYSTAEPSSAFYLLPQRAWELIAGGIVALQFANDGWKYSRTCLGTGLTLIGFSVVYYDKSMPWPYYWALLPVIGTCLVIAANRPDAALFKNQLIQTTGRWSYSAYLWHWPVAVWAVYFGFTKTTPLKIASEIVIVAAILTAGGFLLSLTSKVFGERLGERRRPGLLWGGSALGLTLAIALTVTINEGLMNRRPDSARQYNDFQTAVQDWDYPSECFGADPAGKLRPCRLGAANNRGVLFLGDSLAMQVYSRFAENVKLNPEASFTFLASPGCPPITGIRMVHDRHKCNGFMDKAFQFAKTHHFSRIMLVASWHGMENPEANLICFETGDGCRTERKPSAFFQHVDAAFAALRTRLLELEDRGAEIVIVGPTPSGRWNVPLELAKRRFLGIATTDIEYIDRLEFEKYGSPLKSRLMALAESVGGKFVDPLDFLCESNRCPTVGSDGVPYFKDKCHYRSAVVRTSRFQYLDDAAGTSNRVSAVAMPGNNTP